MNKRFIFGRRTSAHLRASLVRPCPSGVRGLGVLLASKPPLSRTTLTSPIPRYVLGLHHNFLLFLPPQNNVRPVPAIACTPRQILPVKFIAPLGSQKSVRILPTPYKRERKTSLAILVLSKHRLSHCRFVGERLTTARSHFLHQNQAGSSVRSHFTDRCKGCQMKLSVNSKSVSVRSGFVKAPAKCRRTQHQG